MMEVNSIILLSRTIFDQAVSLMSSGVLKGFRNTFHLLVSRGSWRIRKKRPKIIISAAVPLPLLTTVDIINDITPRKKTGNRT